MKALLVVTCVALGAGPLLYRFAAAYEPWRYRPLPDWVSWIVPPVAAYLVGLIEPDSRPDGWSLSATTLAFVIAVSWLGWLALTDALRDANLQRLQLAADLQATRAITEAIDRGWQLARGEDRLASRPAAIANELHALIGQAKEVVATADGKQIRVDVFPSLSRDAYLRLRAAEETLFHARFDRFSAYLAPE
jgi:hypothetical protein